MARASIISLGCPRNQVDSEVIAGSLKREGYKIIASPDGGASVCVINTCAFIDKAREESVDAILEAASLKKKGRIKHLVVAGCLPQLYKEKLSKHLSEVDLVLGTADFPRLPALLKQISSTRRLSFVSSKPDYIYSESSPRLKFTPPHYAYLKISEGCSNFCSYCIISRLRGAFRSRPIPSIVEEVKLLSRGGELKELDIIGQDTTAFGTDIYGKAVLPQLLREICRLKNSVKWIRILYTHPAHYSDGLIAAVRNEDKICKYLDLPVQHISDRILRDMNRRTTKRQITSLIAKLRKNIKGLTLRTSVIVGFPGETEREFRELMKFVADTRFERLGAFIYSREDGTRASRLANQVPDKVKEERFNELMKLQQSISADLNRRLVGRTMRVLIDEKEGTEFIGRTGSDAPEIDQSVIVKADNIKAGEFYKVRITDYLEYDLIGKKVGR